MLALLATALADTGDTSAPTTSTTPWTTTTPAESGGTGSYWSYPYYWTDWSFWYTWYGYWDGYWYSAGYPPDGDDDVTYTNGSYEGYGSDDTGGGEKPISCSGCDGSDPAGATGVGLALI